jgi:hypothetical protein
MQLPYLLNVLNLHKHHYINLKSYLLNTVGSSYTNPNSKDLIPYINFTKDEIKELCHLVCYF